MLPITVAKVAALCEGVVEGNPDVEISGVNALEDASATELSFVATPKAVAAAMESKAGCLLVGEDFANVSQRLLIRVTHPRTAFARVIAALYPVKRPPAGIHATAVVAESARIGDGCFVGPRVTIGERVVLQSNCVVEAGAVISDDVEIGEQSLVHSNVTVYARVRIGARAILHSGCVIGADGFGFAFAGDHYEKFPQIGTVEIGDDVEIGANTCVDRAALGVTVIGTGSKLDNMVHIAHNCKIGRHVVIAAQTGLSGGVFVGDYAVVGGQVGVGDKARIEAKAIVGSGAGILTSKIVRAGEPVWGTPARPLREYLEQLANCSRLPQWRKRLEDLEKRIEQVERVRNT